MSGGVSQKVWREDVVSRDLKKKRKKKRLFGRIIKMREEGYLFFPTAGVGVWGGWSEIIALLYV